MRCCDEPGNEAADCERGNDATDCECGDDKGEAGSAGVESCGDLGVLPAAGLPVPLRSLDEGSAATLGDTCASGGADPERVAARSGIDNRLTGERGAGPSACEADPRRAGFGDAFRLSKMPRPDGAVGGVRGCGAGATLDSRGAVSSGSGDGRADVDAMEEFEDMSVR
ncbi:hypothetical protein [Paraburkholderia sp. UCT70]|uniref:hypothetical protein n=1 Tax=Paraburkholderia sp. UCT70 TaxID=2991068 RepID=UPI003D1F0618